MNTIFSRRIILLFILLSEYPVYGQVPASDRSEKAIARNVPVLEKELNIKGLKIGAPIFIRIFKEEQVLELWVKDTANFKLFKSYKICYFSGALGPKTIQGDRQSPEGFYFINAGRMNPWSRFHLSMNLGFPNQYDRAQGYSGNFLMIHGNCVSIGCYAMTDKVIEEIYTLADRALNQGQAYFRVHIFPFHMTTSNLQRHSGHRWHSFWENLKTGYDRFEKTRVPPNVEVSDGTYVFN